VRKRLPLLTLAAALLAVALTLAPRGQPSPFDVAAFGRLPVLADGRIKPLDTIARTGLLMLQGRQRVVAPDGRRLDPEEWLLDVFFRPGLADAYQVFRIDDPDVLLIFNLTRADGDGGVRYSFRQIQQGLDELDRQGRLAETVEAASRTSFQRAVVELRDRVGFYDRLEFSVQPPGAPGPLSGLSDGVSPEARRSTLETMVT
jgi:hypothetical protein